VRSWSKTALKRCKFLIVTLLEVYNRILCQNVYDLHRRFWLFTRHFKCDINTKLRLSLWIIRWLTDWFWGTWATILNDDHWFWNGFFLNSVKQSDCAINRPNPAFCFVPFMTFFCSDTAQSQKRQIVIIASFFTVRLCDKRQVKSRYSRLNLRWLIKAVRFHKTRPNDRLKLLVCSRLTFYRLLVRFHHFRK
jgi:hypothetical protein